MRGWVSDLVSEWWMDEWMSGWVSQWVINGSIDEWTNESIALFFSCFIHSSFSQSDSQSCHSSFCNFFCSCSAFLACLPLSLSISPCLLACLLFVYLLACFMVFSFLLVSFSGNQSAARPCSLSPLFGICGCCYKGSHVCLIAREDHLVSIQSLVENIELAEFVYNPVCSPLRALPCRLLFFSSCHFTALIVTCVLLLFFSGIVSGNLSPLNPNEIVPAHIFVFNNIIFSYAQDGRGNFEVRKKKEKKGTRKSLGEGEGRVVPPCYCYMALLISNSSDSILSAVLAHSLDFSSPKHVVRRGYITRFVGISFRNAFAIMRTESYFLLSPNLIDVDISSWDCHENNLQKEKQRRRGPRNRRRETRESWTLTLSLPVD